MFNRLLQLPLAGKTSCFLFGPRGTGKTTWLKNHLKNFTYLDLLDQTLYFDLHANPGHLPRYFPQSIDQWIIIDEVQKIPDLLNEVHRAIENDHRKFILTGSSARSLRKKGVNLLAGRALDYTMHPLTAIELGKDFDLKKILQFGQLPMAKLSSDPQRFLKSYVSTYLREEVAQEGLTRNIQNFHRFLEVASFSHGAQLNISAIAREVGLSNDTVNNYFNILEDLLLASRLPIFTRRAKRKLSQHAKFYYFDVGVYQATRPRGPLDMTSEINGPALEGLFLQELRAINAYLNKEYQFYYWRTVSQLEIDFIAYGSRGLIAFEIKNKTKVDSKDLRGIKEFRKDYPAAKGYFIYLGEQEMVIDQINILPLEKALKQLETIL